LDIAEKGKIYSDAFLSKYMYVNAELVWDIVYIVFDYMLTT